MKIIIFIGQLGLGGGERQLFLLLKSIHKRHVFPYVVCFNRAGKYWDEPIQELGVPVFFLTQSNPLVRLVSLYRIVKSIKPEIGISWDIQTNPYLAFLSPLHHFRKTFGGVRCNLFKSGRGAFERLIRTVGLSHFIVNSSQGHNDLVRLGKNKVHVLYNSVEVKSVSREKNLLKEVAGITDDVPTVLFTGGLKPVKNPELLLRAFISISLQVPARLIFVGDGPLRSGLEKKAVESAFCDRIHFLGQIANAYELMQDADVFCLTSHTEGMPNVLLEASIAGLTCIAADVGGVSDLIVQNETGFIFDPGNQDQLESHLIRTLSDAKLRQVIGRNAKARMQKQFSVSAMAEKFSEILFK